MDRLEQRMRQMRVSDGAISWDDFDGAPMASLLAQFRMSEIERYTGICCPKIHWRLYNSVMRADGLDNAHLIMLSPRSLSGAAQCWFASLDASRRRTWDDLAQDFLRQFAFNIVIDVWFVPSRCLNWFMSSWCSLIEEVINKIYNLLHHEPG